MTNEDKGNWMGCLAMGVFCTLLLLCAINVITGFWNILLAIIIAVAVFLIGAAFVEAGDDADRDEKGRKRY